MTKGKNSSIQALRGIGFLLVFLYHAEGRNHGRGVVFRNVRLFAQYNSSRSGNTAALKRLCRIFRKKDAEALFVASAHGFLRASFSGVSVLGEVSRDCKHRT